MEIKDSVAIVTGASRGLGARIAEALAAKGAHVALAARSEEGLEETARFVEKHGVRWITVPTDVTRAEDQAELVRRTTDELGPVNILVNNAGIECVGYSEKLDLDLIDATIATNLTSVIRLTRLVIPSMLERGDGHVVNISSASAKAARPYSVVYAATKHGIVGFSWSLRAELGPRGVGVSVVCPGYVTGEGMFAGREARAGKPPAALRPVTPEKVSDAVVTAVERNQAEVVVGPILLKLSDVVHAIAPDLGITIGRRSGLYKFVKKEATGDD